MRRHSPVIIITLLVITLSCGALAWSGLRPSPARFVVPGAINVQVERAGPGVRVISYELTEPGWDTTLDRRLRAAHWLPPDFSGAPAQYTTYSYVNTHWFGAIWHEANMQGDATHARIIVRRWLRLRWWPSFQLPF